MTRYYSTSEETELMELKQLLRERRRLLPQIKHTTHPAIQIVTTGLYIAITSYMMVMAWFFWVFVVSANPDDMDIGKVIFSFIEIGLIIGLRIKHVEHLSCIRTELTKLNDSIIVKLAYLKSNNLTCELE